MVPFVGEALLPTRIFRFRVSAANVAADDSTLFAQFSKRPFQISDGEPSVLPICQRVSRAETIKVDRNGKIDAAQIGHEQSEMFAPIVLQACLGEWSIFHRTLVGPRINFT